MNFPSERLAALKLHNNILESLIFTIKELCLTYALVVLQRGLFLLDFLKKPFYMEYSKACV